MQIRTGARLAPQHIMSILDCHHRSLTVNYLVYSVAPSSVGTITPSGHLVLSSTLVVSRQAESVALVNVR